MSKRSKRLDLTEFRRQLADLVDEVDVYANGRHIGTWKPSMFQVATKTPPIEGRHPLVADHEPWSPR